MRSIAAMRLMVGITSNFGMERIAGIRPTAGTGRIAGTGVSGYLAAS